MKNYFVYILSNASRSTLYVGVTNNIKRRILEHKESNGFANRYKCFTLVHYERFTNPSVAIAREKEIKKWRRAKKDELIKVSNPKLADLLPELYG